MPLTGPYRILAVDDDALALNLVERVFEEDPDIRTRVTTSPREALTWSIEEPYDLILADQRMGEMTGLELLQRFRVLQPDAVRILLTAYPDMQVALQAINEGLVYRFVLKPWNVDDMRITVRRAVEARRVQQENEELSLKLRKQFDDLVQAERMAMLGRLSAGIGHELGNAVMPLVGQLSMLDMRLSTLLERMGDDALGQQLKHSVATMRTAGKQVMSIVSGLKGYAHKAPEPARWNVNDGVRTVLQLLGHRLKSSATAKVTTELGPVPEIVCRADEIMQVLLNLVGNALDELAEAGGGEVTIATSAAHGAVRTQVRDTGRGLPQRVRENLFAPFVSTKPPGVGTGLGLSICKGIVEAHGGTIGVETAEGQGTTFTVMLPIEPPATPPPQR